MTNQGLSAPDRLYRAFKDSYKEREKRETEKGSRLLQYLKHWMLNQATKCQCNLIVLPEDGQVEQGLLRRQEPQVLGGQLLEGRALPVVPVLRRHHRGAELLGKHLSTWTRRFSTKRSTVQVYVTLRKCDASCNSRPGSRWGCRRRRTRRRCAGRPGRRGRGGSRGTRSSAA